MICTLGRPYWGPRAARALDTIRAAPLLGGAEPPKCPVLMGAAEACCAVKLRRDCGMFVACNQTGHTVVSEP